MDDNNIALVPITLQAKPCRGIDYGRGTDLTLVLRGKIMIAVGDNFSGATLNRLLNSLEIR